jgi:16S rRNA (cytosine967-C5)-methyltransferase
VSLLPGFAEGELYVQDEASQLGAEILAPRAGETVLDPCACPGGKSLAAAIRMGDKGKILAFDLHESKLPLITESAERLSIGSISVAERDATKPDPALFGAVDRAICDVPCSGLGVLAKKPDLRYRDLSRAEELPPLQRAILTATAGCVKQGGRLLHSTCTLNPKENEGVFEAFLAENPDFRAVPFRVADLDAPKGMLTLYPHIHGTDGFFYALAERVK